MSITRPSLSALAALAVALAAASVLMIFFIAPEDADQGLSQKIFYVHVPIALTAYACFGLGAWKALRLLLTRGERYDLESYTGIHQGTIFGALTLVTGSIWAKASWGHWWEWGEPTLVSFLIVFLLYCTYQPMRFSIADPEKQGRYAAVFAITAGAFVPLNFVAVRLATPLLHPRVFSRAAGDMPGSMRLTWLVSLVAITLLFITLCKLELTSKGARDHLRRLRRQLEAREENERVFVGAH